MAGPLAGIKVLEMANFISGPYAGMLLADLGAEVIKAEMPGTGDPFRTWEGAEGGLRPTFAGYNRGKKSVTVNLQAEGGRDVYRRLASATDVLLENFRPGTLDRLEVGYAALRDLNPRLIYCAISGMGSSGPYRDRPTYDAIAQSISGLSSQFTDVSRPQPIGPAMADQLTGMYSAYGILAALATRNASGTGQLLEVNMLSACLAFLTVPIAEYLLGGEVGGPLSRPHKSQSYAFVAGDGLPFAVHLSSPPKFWRGLTEVAGRPELQEDPRFKTKLARTQHYDDLHGELAGVFGTRPRAEWLALLEAHDVPVAPIYTIPEALADPQVQHLGMVQRFGEGERATPLVGFPVAFAETPCLPGLPPPLLGVHTDAVLGQLSYGPTDLARLRAEGAI